MRKKTKKKIWSENPTQTWLAHKWHDKQFQFQIQLEFFFGRLETAKMSERKSVHAVDGKYK